MVEKHDAADASHLCQYLAVFGAVNGKSGVVIVESKIEPVSLERTVKHHVNGHGIARARRDYGSAEVAVVLRRRLLGRGNIRHAENGACALRLQRGWIERDR